MPELKRVEKLDDLHYADGEHIEATEVREYTIGGKTYRNLLTKEHAEEFDADLLHYTSVAEQVVQETRSSSSTRSGAGRSASSGSSQNKERALNKAIREWAASQGMKISERGRIPAPVKEAYLGANPDRKPDAEQD